ncbi:LysR substrate-binding domain-containing protein [Marinomonas primoryensis]|jgi:DNA-binding transcriptional LysR family regulator|uniref:LysR family transcriptional regulator n=1 Tax=Marinomonas primoryensis TaxID=178399 RepID=A0A859CUE6_9GAMM|nr:LysR substrate-binding domain-containing protein [Marinomonas primoryensis]QKK79522.1 LysR family transcriptional regulator [Marinomonas primoryensis]|tara:strand:- start:6718 stop:7626 length:909 start_codon:yes stop_codon:yes gene_type:complete
MAYAVTLEALRVLEAIHQLGSFAAAADALFKVPSALTYTVKKLEEDLGVALFDRSRQKAVLTPAGHLVLEQGQAILEAAMRLEDSIKQFESGWEPKLRIARDTVLLESPLMTVVGDFLSQNRPVEITLSEEAVGGGWDALQDGRADLVIGVTGELPKGKVHTQALGAIDFVFAIAPTHPLALVEGAITAVQLRQYPAIVVADSSKNLPARNIGIFESRQVLRVDTMRSKIQAQCLGLGVGYLPKHRIVDELKSGRLVVRQCEFPRPNLIAYLAWRKDSPGRGLSWFVEQLIKQDWQLIPVSV